jgi:hypothetical protein
MNTLGSWSSDASTVSLPAAPLAPAPAPLTPLAAPVLEVAPGARWFREPTGRVVYLGNTRVMRRLLAALVARHREAPGSPMTTGEIFRAAWPSESVSVASAQARVYMTISRLRSFGLAGILVHRGDGYLLAPHVTVHVKDEA